MAPPDEQERARLAERRAELASKYVKPFGQRPQSNARGIHHAALICSDVEQTIRFYQELLGFPLVERGTSGIQGGLLLLDCFALRLQSLGFGLNWRRCGRDRLDRRLRQGGGRQNPVRFLIRRVHIGLGLRSRTLRQALNPICG